MGVKVIGILSFLFALFLVFITGGNFKSELKEQMTKEDDNYFVLKARNLHNLSYVLGSVVIFLTSYFSKGFRAKPASGIVLLLYALLVLGTVMYTVYKAKVRIVYDNGQITYYSFNRVRTQGNISGIDIDKCRNKEHPNNSYNMRLLYQDTKIVFHDGSFISYQTSMKNAYKLEAILKKRGCFQYKNIKK